MESRLETERLLLRPLSSDDVPHLVEYCGSVEIYDNTSRIPYPYTEKHALDFIQMAEDGFNKGTEVIFGVKSKDVGHLVGCVGYILDRENDCAELGFWIGKPFWGRGYCTEAARRALLHAFQESGVNLVYANHFCKNVGSGKVLQKLGMTREGRLRQRVRKGDTYIDVESYSILQSEFVQK